MTGIPLRHAAPAAALCRRVIVRARVLPASPNTGGPAPPPVFEQGVSESGTYTLSGRDLEFHTGGVGGLIFLNLAHGAVNDRSTVTVRTNPGPAWYTLVYKRSGS